jgi:hypothetical protein
MLRNGTATPYLLEVNDVGSNVPFVGAGDWDGCTAYYAYLLNKRTECTTDALNNRTLAPTSSVPVNAQGLPLNGRLPPINADKSYDTCSVNGVYQPPVGDTPLVAFSGYTYLYQFFGLPANASAAQLATVGRAFCADTLAAAMAGHPGQPVQFTAAYCSTAAYVYTLWTEGFGIAPDSHQVTVAVGPGSSAFSYAYGSVLFEANAASWAYSGGASSHSGVQRSWEYIAYTFIALFALAVLVAIFALVRLNRAGKTAVVVQNNAYSSSLNPGGTILGDAFDKP